MKIPSNRPISDGRKASTSTPERPTKSPRSRRDGAMVVKPRRDDLVMGEVKILKRGEKIVATEFSPAEKKKKKKQKQKMDPDRSDRSVLRSTHPIGPEPGILPVQTKIFDRNVCSFSGSGFMDSPPPSSLPKPSFSVTKKDLMDRADLATRGLQYMLRLELI